MTATETATGHETPSGSPLLRVGLVYAGLCVLCILVFYDTADSLVRVWWGTPTFNHGFFVAPMAAYLIWMRRHTLVGVPIRQEWLALPLIVLAGLVWLVGYAGDVRLLQHAGFVGILIAMAGGLVGRHMLRLIWFPIAFLAFMVPAGDQLVPRLQDITADFSVTLLGWVNIPVWRDGVFLQIPNGMFEVAEACAGIRFLIANVVVAFVFAYLAYSKWWKWVIFIAISIAVPIFANGVRAFGIIYIAHVTDNEYAVGVDHLVYGWGFFTVIMLLCLFIGNLFADRRIGDFEPDPRAASRPVPAWNWPFVAAAAALMALGPAYAAVIIDSGSWQGQTTLQPPTVAGPWQPGGELQPPWKPVFRGASAELLQTYRDGSDQVSLFIAYYPAQGQGREVIYHANRMADDETWKRLETRRIGLTIDGAPMQVRLERMKGHGGATRVAAYWYWIAGRFTADPVQAKLYQIAGALSHGNKAAAAVAVTMLQPVDADGLEPLRDTIQRFLDATPNLNAYLRRQAGAH
ncbi:MAG: exosortase A [Alphaproteobacteria bacterium]|nr:exosortase A [Alphaproteobacteria bacterium]MCB9929199.1 exosortase A [Alphaproteobacteria bacterium]